MREQKRMCQQEKLTVVCTPVMQSGLTSIVITSAHMIKDESLRFMTNSGTFDLLYSFDRAIFIIPSLPNYLDDSVCLFKMFYSPTEQISELPRLYDLPCVKCVGLVSTVEGTHKRWSGGPPPYNFER